MDINYGAHSAILCFMSGGLDTGRGYLREKGEILQKFQTRQDSVRFVAVLDFIALYRGTLQDSCVCDNLKP